MGATPFQPNDSDGVVFATTGHIVGGGESRAKDQAYMGLKGSSRNALMEKITANAYDPDFFTEPNNEPYIYFLEPSNSNIDFYGTRMMTSSLKEYAQNLTDGIAFLNDHDISQRIGQSIDGWYIKPEANAVGNDNLPLERVIGAFYTVPGRRFSNIATDDFIAGMRSGIFRDVSVSFFSDNTTCSICGKDMYRGWLQLFLGECDHVPGMKYDVEGDDGKSERRICAIQVNDGYIVETSNVYDGATPNAAYLKANMMLQAGKLDARMVAAFEQQFRQKLPVAKTVITGFDPAALTGTNATIVTTGSTTTATGVAATDDRATGTEEQDMAKLADATVTIDWAQLRPGLVELATSLDLTVADDATPDTILDMIGDEFRDLRQKVTDMEDDAKVGANYRAELIEDALAAGVRAKGDAFKADTYKAVLGRSSIDGIKQMREDWIAEGDARLSGPTDQVGGRRSVTGDDPIDPAKTDGDPAPAKKRDNIRQFAKA